MVLRTALEEVEEVRAKTTRRSSQGAGVNSTTLRASRLSRKHATVTRSLSHDLHFPDSQSLSKYRDTFKQLVKNNGEISSLKEVLNNSFNNLMAKSDQTAGKINTIIGLIFLRKSLKHAIFEKREGLSV